MNAQPEAPHARPRGRRRGQGRRQVAARVAAVLLATAMAACAGASGTGSGEPASRPTGRPGSGGQADVGPGVAPAMPGPGSPEERAALASCPEDVWPADGSGQAMHLGTHEGASVFEIAAGAGEAAVIVAVGKIRPESPVACVVLEPAETPAPVAGSFWPQGGRAQAVLLVASECHPAFCPGVLLIRDGERALGALYLPEACDRALSMEALSWFASVDSLRLTCHRSIGAGYREIVSIVHVGASGPAPVLALVTGTAEVATQEERETPGFCEHRPVGWVRLVEKGERPVIRVFDPGRGQPGENGKGTGLVADFRFEQIGPGPGRFEQIGPGTLERYDARAWCRSGKLSR